MVYAAVLSYFSVAFMGFSTLPAWLQSCVVSENPDATLDEVAAIYGSRFSAFTFVQGTLIALVAVGPALSATASAAGSAPRSRPSARL